MSKVPKSNRRAFLTAGFGGTDDGSDATRSTSPEEASLPKIHDHHQGRTYSHLEYYSSSAMACQFDLMLNLQQYPQAAASALACFEQIASLEDQLTIYREHSEVSFINRNAWTQGVECEHGLFELLSLARQITSDTDGAFDITSGPLSDLWGFRRHEGRVANDADIARTKRVVGMQYVVLCDRSKEIRFEIEGVQLNLGGIGKGFALDSVASLLSSSAIDDYVMHGGQSSVVARGQCLSKRRDQPPGWTIGLSHPRQPDCRLAEIQLVDAALGTSGTGRQGFFYKGKRLGHIIDPRTGRPSADCLSSTVICGSAAQADALATAFFVMSPDDVQNYCVDHLDVAAILVLPQSDQRGFKIESFNLRPEQWRILD